jgi:Skp family chaperone for outer membrane proteins
MRQEIEDKIGALEAQKQQIETDLAAEKQKLQDEADNTKRKMDAANGMVGSQCHTAPVHKFLLCL